MIRLLAMLFLLPGIALAKAVTPPEAGGWPRSGDRAGCRSGGAATPG